MSNYRVSSFHLTRSARLLLAHRDARYYWLLLSEGHLSRRLFGPSADGLSMIAALPLPVSRRVSEPGQKAHEGSEAIQRGSVSGEADWGGQNQHTGSAESRPIAFYPDHTHRGTAAHVILEGEMSEIDLRNVTSQGKT